MKLELGLFGTEMEAQAGRLGGIWGLAAVGVGFAMFSRRGRQGLRTLAVNGIAAGMTAGETVGRWTEGARDAWQETVEQAKARRAEALEGGTPEDAAAEAEAPGKETSQKGKQAENSAKEEQQ